MNASKRVPKIIAGILAFTLMATLAFPHAAFARSAAGGGEVSHFDAGKWAAGTVIGALSSSVGGMVNSEIMGSGGGFMGGFNSWMDNYSLNFATGEVGYLTSMYGAYSGWDPRTTLFASSVATSLTSGAMGSLTLEGAGMGLTKGLVSGAILYSAADEKGQYDPWVGAVAGIAGSFAGNMTGAAFSGSEFDFSKVMTQTAISAPAYMVNMAANYITQDMKDPMDRFMVQQAFEGLEQIGSGSAAALIGGTYTSPEIISNPRAIAPTDTGATSYTAPPR